MNFNKIIHQPFRTRCLLPAPGPRIYFRSKISIYNRRCSSSFSIVFLSDYFYLHVASTRIPNSFRMKTRKLLWFCMHICIGRFNSSQDQVQRFTISKGKTYNVRTKWFSHHCDLWWNRFSWKMSHAMRLNGLTLGNCRFIVERWSLKASAICFLSFQTHAVTINERIMGSVRRQHLIDTRFNPSTF